jgi:hypothetical protein
MSLTVAWLSEYSAEVMNWVLCFRYMKHVRWVYLMREVSWSVRDIWTSINGCMNELKTSPRVTSAWCSSSWEGLYCPVSRSCSWPRCWISETTFGTFCLSAGSIKDSTTFSLTSLSQIRWDRRWFLLTTVVWMSRPSRLCKRVANPKFMSAL